MRYNLVSSQYVSKKKFLFLRHRKESDGTARQSLEKFGLPNSVQFDQKDFTKWSPDNRLQLCHLLNVSFLVMSHFRYSIQKVQIIHRESIISDVLPAAL